MSAQSLASLAMRSCRYPLRSSRLRQARGTATATVQSPPKPPRRKANGGRKQTPRASAEKHEKAWRSLGLCAAELRLEFTLVNGQCFGWQPFPHADLQPAEGFAQPVSKRLRRGEANEGAKKQKPSAKASRRAEGVGEKTAAGALLLAQAAERGGGAAFRGVFRNWVLQIRQRPGEAPEFTCLNDPSATHSQQLHSALRDYFHSSVTLASLHHRWCRRGDGHRAHGKKHKRQQQERGAEGRMEVLCRCLPGMRVLRQDPLECLLSFICSSNNNVPRIRLLLERFKQAFGTRLWTETNSSVQTNKEETPKERHYYAFPTMEQLEAASEEQLRALGFGYRAKFIIGTLEKLRAKGPTWLHSLRTLDAQAVQEELIQLPGVGRKVADCVALFSLDQTACVPVDVHVWNIACRDFDRSLSEAKSLTPTIYARVGELFVARYGDYAGWAHSLHFAAELPMFRALLPQHIQAEMKQYTLDEKRRKAELKAEKAARKAKREATKKKNTKH